MCKIQQHFFEYNILKRQQKIKENTALYCFTRNYLPSKKKFSCLCCCKFIDYFIKKLIPIKCVTRINLGNIQSQGRSVRSSRLAILLPEFRQSYPWGGSVYWSNKYNTHAALPENFTIIPNILNDVARLPFASCKSSQHLLIFPQMKIIIPSEPHQIHFNMKFFKPSELKHFLKHQFCCRNNIL